jgi:Astacin (Peptidase family M12A)
MSSSEQELRQALSEIARIAEKASRHFGHDHGSQGHREEDRGTAAGPDIGCVPRQLPERLQVKAAQTAMRINPANGVNMAAMAGLGLSDSIMDPLRIAVLTAKYWGPQRRQLTVSFMESTPADLRARIVSHLNAWNRSGGISFVETRGTGQVRISRSGGGYWSYLGTDILHIPLSQQTMNLEGFTMNTSDSEYRRVIRHEAGHTLGFPHEHMRKELIARIDRQKAYDYFWRTQRWDRAMVDQQVLTPLDDRSIMATPPDQDSIMCYQLPSSITRDGQPIRGGTDINATDAAFCGRLYPKSGAAADVSLNGPDREDHAMSANAAANAAANIGDWDPHEDVEPDVASFH